MQPNNLKVKVNEFVFEFTNQEIIQIQRLSAEQRLFQGQIIHGRAEYIQPKTYGIQLQGEHFTAQIQTPLDQQIEAMGFHASASSKIKEIKAPMPGLVLDILVSENEEVQENDKLLILEAMKMENLIRIPQEAIIGKICVEKGQAVEKGQILMELL